MAQPFPSHPNLEGGFAPIHMECVHFSATDLTHNLHLVATTTGLVVTA